MWKLTKIAVIFIFTAMLFIGLSGGWKHTPCVSCTSEVKNYTEEEWKEHIMYGDGSDEPITDEQLEGLIRYIKELEANE